MEAAFSNGVRAALVVEFTNRRSELWSPHWTVAEPGDPEQRIWGVCVRARLRPPLAAGRGPGLAAAAARLEHALRLARDVARDPGLEEWGPWLDAAQAQLTTADPAPRFHPDMLPGCGYGLAARRLLAGASGAWVFGGMGSWNDGGPLNPGARAEYERATAALYAACLDAIIEAANAYERLA